MSEERKIKVKLEDVDGVPKPPRARVDDAVMATDEAAIADATVADPAAADATLPEAVARKRDYLEGFLGQAREDVATGAPGGSTYEAIIDALKGIFDPEIPVNIYDLGLIYGVEVTDDGHAVVTMTLTTPHCPVAESMPGDVELCVGSVPGVGHAEVNLVWDPPWDPQKMSDEAKLELGML